MLLSRRPLRYCGNSHIAATAPDYGPEPSLAQGADMIDIILLGVLVVVSFGVFIWACIGLINPKWARFPNRASSVGVLVLAGMIFGSSASASLIVSVFLYYLVYFFAGPG